jgi:hypothetical protein
MCDEQWTQRERTTFFSLGGGEEKKKMLTDFFLQNKKKIPLTFFCFSWRLDSI